MPKISIIIPVYNSEKYLKDCLQSVINQTLSDIEIICVNNGSTDHSLSILKKYASEDDRIILINIESPNLGAARNTGVNAASGEYLMFVDSDDWVKTESCEKLYNIAKKYDLEILQGRYTHVPHMNFGNFKCKSTEYYKKQSGKTFWQINQNISIANWDKIWKRNFFINNNLYNPEGVYFEDLLTTVKGMLSVKAFMVIDYQFYYYRYVNDSIMHQSVTGKHIESSLIRLQQIKSFIEDSHIETEPSVVLFYFKVLFIHYALYKRDDFKTLKYEAQKIDFGLIKSAPLKIKLAKLLPEIAAFLYPAWAKRIKFNSFLSCFFIKLNQHTNGTAFFRRSP